MKKILILFVLVIITPFLAYAVDSYDYDRNINIPAVTTSEGSTERVCAENLTEDGEPQYLYVTLAETEGADYRRVDE